jgi:hypothetical protein
MQEDANIRQEDYILHVRGQSSCCEANAAARCYKQV